MEFSQLQYFMTVANCGKITDASEILHVSQSAISMAINRLENELDVKLFEKQGRLIRPTKNGYRLLEMVFTPMAELDHAKNEMLAANMREPDVVSISVEMPDFATNFENVYSKYHPEARFLQSMDTTEAARQKIATAKVDFCLSFEPFHNADLISIPIITERASIQLSKEHPLAGNKYIRLEDLSDTSFVSFCPEYSYRRWSDGMCFFAGFRPKICFEVCDTQSLVYLVTQKNAATFIAQSTMEMHTGAVVRTKLLVTIPLENAFCERTAYLSYHKSRVLSPAAKNFLSFALKMKKYCDKYKNFTVAVRKMDGSIMRTSAE